MSGAQSDGEFCRYHLGFDGAADGFVMTALRPDGHLVVVDETHHWDAQRTAQITSAMMAEPVWVLAHVTESARHVTDSFASFAAGFAGLRAPTTTDIRRGQEVYAALGRSPRMTTVDSSSPDTSQEYFLDLLRRIDDVTEGS